MPSFDLDSFVARATTLVDSSPPATKQETRRWLVEPFLETLGWTVRADSCLPDRVVDETQLEYVLAVESVPALFVAVESATESLDGTRANAIQSAMAWSGVDRAIYTNGRDYLLLAGSSEIDYCALELAELEANESAIATYSRAALGHQLGRHTRAHVARQLAVERSSLTDDITNCLTDAVGQGEVYADEFASATDRFLEQLLVTFAEYKSSRLNADTDTAADVSVQFSESAITDDRQSPSSGPVSSARSDSSGPEQDDGVAGGDAEPETPTDTTTADTDATDPDHATGHSDTDTNGTDSTAATDDGEYVVRFFNERGSIGAVGHSSAAGALVEAAEYLLERGLAGVEVPWAPDDSGKTVLNDAPVRADGSPMDDPKPLSRGLYLETAGDIDEQAARVEALTERAGLRAMVTGDWEPK
ncbi:hypothetical protein [Natrinema hispanicum]|uniref:Type I restriction enzyme R protein N-terminal domain-containing protein n=1 Tax=Natrinema hispanicum TaxID=392421 RepID=A0A1I0IZZ3_9EURY|nr:hypothetical protein [Natrinema hispanicum]SDD37260.1 hypothetical protein SAMN05192552_102032 [Natrinema hispanicum]SEU02308.1 hypothetical protein SAMN04488694_1282 [Natrinema hispanicum]